MIARAMHWRRLAIGARGLCLAWEGTPNHWKWTSLPKSRLAAVSHIFKSAADSDLVWEKFLPSDYKLIISNSVSSSSLSTSLPKKDLYFHLCHYPVFINNCTMSFALEKETGKKCYMVGARGLCIEWGSTANFWKWTSLPKSRFPEVAELVYFWFFEVNARIETRILSNRTNYAAYLVFKFGKSTDGFGSTLLASGVYVEGINDEERQGLFLDPSRNTPQLFHDRRDGWMEIEMGEFFNKNGDDGTLLCSLLDFDRFGTRHGLVIEGIELRPKKRLMP
ncbi:putative F-box protein PP2-B12 isoform X2 [Citrus sinensis]|uniref:putative F-box protein PP2-B12 isoform X2 n=1 Tax=Citrus sinensis TaxID=2711 RepID=UPI0022779EE2|nr:putative F-box protein PP2-B12 isoform X2 [Citrus sinensis]